MNSPLSPDILILGRLATVVLLLTKENPDIQQATYFAGESDVLNWARQIAELAVMLTKNLPVTERNQ